MVGMILESLIHTALFYLPFWITIYSTIVLLVGWQWFISGQMYVLSVNLLDSRPELRDTLESGYPRRGG